MKKFLVGALAAFMCLGCFTGCDFLNQGNTGSESENVESSVVEGDESNASENNESESEGENSENSDSTEENEYNLDAAKMYVRGLYKDKNVDTSSDYRVLNSVPVGGVTYTITWSVDVTEGVTLEIEGNETIVNVDEMTPVDIEYVLTATIADPAGNTTSFGLNRKVLKLEEEVFAAISSTPVEGVAYTLHTYQSTKGKDCYFTGKMSGFYFATSETKEEAVDIFVEYVAGSETEFYPYFMSGDKKQYIGMRVSADGAHDNLVFDNDPVSVFVWNDTIQTITTTIVDRDNATTEFYLGNFSTHMTISGSAISHANDAGTNIACLKTSMSRSEVSAKDKLANEKDKLSLAGMHFIGEGTLNLDTIGLEYPDVAIAWAIEGEGAVLNGNTVTLTAGNEILSSKLTATLTCDDESMTKEFDLRVIPNNEAAIIEAAFSLPSGQAFASEVTLTGVITSIDTPFDAEFSNVTVTMKIGDKYMQCYRMGGNGADVIAAGYTITVSGIIKNFNGTYEFDQGCFLNSYEYGEPPVIETPEINGQKVATFDFGANGDASHVDGTTVTAATDFTDGNYTLTINAVADNKVYSGAFDATGNSCLKIGTSSVVGSFSFTVADDVKQVIIYVAKYKAKTSKINVNGDEYTLNQSSNDGQYEAIVVDTSSNKTVEFTTLEGATRVMINTIEFYD